MYYLKVPVFVKNLLFWNVCLSLLDMKCRFSVSVIFSKASNFVAVSKMNKTVPNIILNNFYNDKYLPTVKRFEENRQFLHKGTRWQFLI
jgi:hypothetical protein